VTSPDNSVLVEFLFFHKNQKEKALAFAEYNYECYRNSVAAKNLLELVKTEMQKK
jgi:hypothetical protein